MPSLSQLEYIIAVADYRHFGKAAKACNISQPTLSHQIKKIESLCKITLFDRMKKPIIATAEGEAFLKQARVIVREHRRLVEMTRQSLQLTSGEFKLAVIPTVSPSLVPLFIESFSTAYPKVELFIEEMKTGAILEELRNDRLDAALMATPLGSSGFIEEPLYYETFQLYLSQRHPLLRKKTIAENDLDGSEMWLLEDGHCFKDQVVKFCSIRKNEFAILENIHFRSGTLDTLKAVVRRGRGYTMMPSLFTAQLSAQEFNEQVRLFHAPIPAREISLVYRRDHWKQNVINAIKKSITENLPPQVELLKSKKIQVLGAC